MSKTRQAPGAVHRAHGEAAAVLALGGLGEEHVLAVVLVVARPVPELLVEDLRGLDADVAALVELLAHLALDDVEQNGPAGQPERHARRLLAQREESELGPEAAVVVGPRGLEALEVLGEVLLGKEGGAVDAGQHLAVLVAAPVGTGDRVQLHGLDAPGRRRVRPAAEVLEVAVAVEADGLDALLRLEVLDQLDLVVLPLGAELLQRLVGGHVAPLERLVGLDVALHRLLDPRQLVLGDLLAAGKLDVVVKAVGDRRADRDLRLRPELEHGLGHHVGGVVADQLQGLGVAVGEDRDRLAVCNRRREVASLIADANRKGGLGEAGADRGCGVGAAGALGQLERRSVGECDRQSWHGGHARCRRPSIRAAPPPAPDERR